MGTASWATPVGVLAGICVAMFIFIWWWFPRAYKRGVKLDMERVDEENRQRALYRAQQEDLEAGTENPAAEGVVTADGETAPAPPPPAYKPTTFKYTPPAYTSY